MKRIIIIFAIFLTLTLSSCGNRSFIDTNFSYDKAIIKLPDGTAVTVTIQNWNDYSDSDMVQIITSDGVIYYTHSSNVVFIGNK